MSAADDPNRGKKSAVIMAVIGIFIELVAIVLIAADRITVAAGTPLIVVGMFLAFVPIFVAARRARR